MTNVMEASKVVKEFQVTAKSPSKSPKGDFKALFKVEAEALNADRTEEEEKASQGLEVDGENAVTEPEQAITDEKPDENNDAMMQLSYLIQGNPPLQIKSSVTNDKSKGDPQSAETLKTPTGNLSIKETPQNQRIMDQMVSLGSVKVEETEALNVETPALLEIQKDNPQALKETESHTIPEGLAALKPMEALPEKLSKSDVFKANQNKNELEQEKIEGKPLESKALPKVEEGLLKDDLLSASGAEKKNETTGKAQKESQSDGTMNFPTANKASEVQKTPLLSSPEGTKAQSENLELATKEILHQMETLTDGNKSSVKVKLNPKELGEMEISLSMEEGRLTGKILVGNKEIQQIFTDKLHELNQTLKENRIDVASFEVKLSLDQNQNQEQARHQGRRAMDYPGRFNSQRNGSAQTEEWIKPASTSKRGIDILA